MWFDVKDLNSKKLATLPWTKPKITLKMNPGDNNVACEAPGYPSRLFAVAYWMVAVRIPSRFYKISLHRFQLFKVSNAQRRPHDGIPELDAQRLFVPSEVCTISWWKHFKIRFERDLIFETVVAIWQMNLRAGFFIGWTTGSSAPSVLYTILPADLLFICSTAHFERETTSCQSFDHVI